MSSLKRLTFQYKGLCNTPNLWKEATFYEYPHIEIPFTENVDLTTIDTEKHHRLGKLVEVFYQINLETQADFRSLTHNVQIQIDKHQTIGEIDFIVETPEKEIHHIELAYKFYLYKTDIPYEIDKWVGPNLKDSLTQKLQKLTEKQFPMLHHSKTQEILQEKGIDTRNIQQSIHLKGQLYVPFNLKNHTFPHVNNDCIQGFYISYTEIDSLFALATYHIPVKQDWLIDPKHHTEWISFTDAKPIILEQIKVNHSPLVWMKRGEIYKRFFITFW
ncbi:DUF1853 family protein [Wenyingzhuangia sp. 2_MG-2023]|uniref:DUF1853 family protein n=1 Tax=Wenyingzhuangia sp. 2_MG-2023 TaxID=3062639 RepID=UPI0026E3E526|nr:DUF1853 family protein [Wenyingzhuangia sp. 2_MG-2023]MDO6737257.1 DUF1853 family protein [Wenyingzhuangia sp. 2_MG-2023]